ncbi:MAG TPA: MarR family transcriptional regulator [Solirubrobacteraceae bacterium]|nr:MarR family transcriptional regulator [Solirubrobacteraceae bacterium]
MTYIQKQSGEGFLAMVERHDLGLTQIKALLVLERRAQELSVKELAEHLGLSLAATSRTSEGLLQRGYVERREDEHDRRIKRVGLTGAGREIALALHRERLAGLEAFASSLSPRQRRRLSGALASLLEREEIAACHASSGAGARG